MAAVAATQANRGILSGMDVLTPVFEVLKSGGPVGVAAVAIAAWFFERRENRAMQYALLEMAKQQVAANLRQEQAIASLRDVLSNLRR